MLSFVFATLLFVQIDENKVTAGNKPHFEGSTIEVSPHKQLGTTSAVLHDDERNNQSIGQSFVSLRKGLKTAYSLQNGPFISI